MPTSEGRMLERRGKALALVAARDLRAAHEAVSKVDDALLGQWSGALAIRGEIRRLAMREPKVGPGLDELARASLAYATAGIPQPSCWDAATTRAIGRALEARRSWHAEAWAELVAAWIRLEVLQARDWKLLDVATKYGAGLAKYAPGTSLGAVVKVAAELRDDRDRATAALFAVLERDGTLEELDRAALGLAALGAPCFPGSAAEARRKQVAKVAATCEAAKAGRLDEGLDRSERALARVKALEEPEDDDVAARCRHLIARGERVVEGDARQLAANAKFCFAIDTRAPSASADRLCKRIVAALKNERGDSEKLWACLLGLVRTASLSPERRASVAAFAKGRSPEVRRCCLGPRRRPRAPAPGVFRLIANRRKLVVEARLQQTTLRTTFFDSQRRVRPVDLLVDLGLEASHVSSGATFGVFLDGLLLDADADLVCECGDTGVVAEPELLTMPSVEWLLADGPLDWLDVLVIDFAFYRARRDVPLGSSPLDHYAADIAAAPLDIRLKRAYLAVVATRPDYDERVFRDVDVDGRAHDLYLGPRGLRFGKRSLNLDRVAIVALAGRELLLGLDGARVEALIFTSPESASSVATLLAHLSLCALAARPSTDDRRFARAFADCFGDSLPAPPDDPRLRASASPSRQGQTGSCAALAAAAILGRPQRPPLVPHVAPPRRGGATSERPSKLLSRPR